MFKSSESVACIRLLASSNKEFSKCLQVVPSSKLNTNTTKIDVALRLRYQDMIQLTKSSAAEVPNILQTSGISGDDGKRPDHNSVES